MNTCVVHWQIMRFENLQARIRHIVRQHDGSLRLCVDYRALNTKIRKDAYPLPRIDEALAVLKGANYFCSLDLAHGYNQIPMVDKDIEKTAFRIGTGGLYEYLRMPSDIHALDRQGIRRPELPDTVNLPGRHSCLRKHIPRNNGPSRHGISQAGQDLTRFNKICHPSQRPRWQVDKEAIGLSRVQQCSSTYNPPS